MKIAILDPHRPDQPFPPLNTALAEPNGLLAVGGCLSATRLLNAYRHGIFPWYNANEPILWWSPNPRLVLFPEHLLVSRSLRKTLHKNTFTVTFDTAFDKVIAACGESRQYREGTWITQDIMRAYRELHRLGFAHSAETWREGELVGGLYGVAIGRVFFGESMFHTETDASKTAFAVLVRHLRDWHFELIDCQVYTHHLASLGAELIGRNDFMRLLDRYCTQPAAACAWQAA
ncbi:leucyl/phenylalanyl-tRNA--protein transferase [Candidatus Methylomicrobium oryzae]|uniref:leucyl/phenylalanyl-tRNA--protein transferase n=1 Tax=Candidatus Methylomicrobium oryzae TaxID=2802053 RepID=UPI001922673D|nr:leucyl/phenylalanyl-tRNA--protein transferase [Methylomicrobium sp. RS1]MBL1263137.1 leucyl/phenylalanyl-tRNA--protein transferase [Methylomicrobium sp. RS1]